MAALRGRATALALLLSGASLAAGARSKVTPVEKVVSLLQGLETTVKTEGQEEAAAYDKFACFCKSATEKESAEILEYKQSADTLSAKIAEDTANKAIKSEELEGRKKKHEQLEAELAATKEQYEKDTTQYKLDEADLAKAVSSLDGAKTALEGAKAPGAALLALRATVRKGSELARTLDAKLPKTEALLQSKAKVDPDSPEYKYHSDGILSTLEELHAEFSAKKTTLDAEWTKTKSAAESTILALGTDIDSNNVAMTELDESIGKLTTAIAEAREDIVGVDAMLKDDKVYMTDLTKRCEARAKDWDQRSQMRADELAAISEALAIIIGKVKDNDAHANVRSEYPVLLQRRNQGPAAPAVPPSFVQLASAHKHVRQATANNANATGQLSEADRAKVVDLLAKEGASLKSQSISMLAMKIAGDPFAKVKDLIQTLIERLLKESTNEATKEGYCNTELGKAKKERGFRWKEVKTLNVEIKSLELKKDELEAEISELTDSIDDLWEALNTTKEDRETSHGLNMETLSKAKDGLDAITDAIVVLKTFYAKGAAAVSLVQVRASPVTEEGPGFEGNYGGNQVASKGIIGMLSVIKTDFQRTIEVTTSTEKKEQAEFVEFDRTSRSDISGKSQKKELDEQDLESTVASLDEGMASLKTEMDLLDAAVKYLEEIKPMCTDFGMPYEVRVAQREKEILALKKASCALGAPGLYPEC